MKLILEEMWHSGKEILDLYASEKNQKSEEYESLRYVETKRKRENIKRSMVFALVLMFLIIIALIMMVVREQAKQMTVTLMPVTLIILALYVKLSEKYYKISDEGYKDKKTSKKATLIYMIFWLLYDAILAFILLSYNDASKSYIAWLGMIFISVMLPMFSVKESALMMPIAGVEIALFVIQMHIGIMVFVMCIPIFIVLLTVVQINYVERMMSFYNESKTLREIYESKRRVDNIFEEMFDLVCELNLNNDACTLLRNNNKYMGKGEVPISAQDLFSKLGSRVHEEDLPLFAKTFNIDYIVEEFRTGQTQLYLEMRIKKNDNEYTWASALMTKEHMPDIDKPMVLCLIHDIEDRKRNEDRLRLEAEKDPLTQLYNKMTTKSMIEECIEKNSGMQHAFIIIDIDNFKTINDTKGHIVGDQILLAFAAELNKNFRDTDILGRTGGDEFIVLIRNVQSVAMVCDKLQRLTSSFKKYGIDNGFPGRLSTSIGVSMFNKDGKTYEELFKKADAALYEAKRNGKDQYKFSISKT